MPKLYDSPQWRALRRVKLSHNPLCEACQAAGLTKAAQCVDHIIPVRSGGLPLPPLDGLRSLCIACHNRKTASVDQGQTIARHVQGFAPDGTPLDADDPWNQGAPNDAPSMAAIVAIEGVEDTSDDAPSAPAIQTIRAIPPAPPARPIDGGGLNHHLSGCHRPAADLNVELVSNDRGKKVNLPVSAPEQDSILVLGSAFSEAKKRPEK